MSQSIFTTTTFAGGALARSVHGAQGIRLHDSSPFTVVDCDSVLSDMVDILADLPVNPPSIYVDLEGIKLSRQGSISILQIHVLPKNHTYLIDIHQLQGRAFSTTGGDSGQSLKTILEDKNVPKAFFDVRNDSDALFYHYQISLSGVDDIQLMELVTRTFGRQYLNGLQRCIENDAIMTPTEKKSWNLAKEKGLRLFAPERGGRYEVFNERPLAEEISQYCVQDVQFLPRLWSCYRGRMSREWIIKVQKESEARVLLSQRQDYNGHGRHKAMAPAGW